MDGWNGPARRWFAGAGATIVLGAIGALLATGRGGDGDARPATTSAAAPPPSAAPPEPQRFAKDGIAVAFTYGEAAVPGGPLSAPAEGDRVEVRFQLTDATTGEPLRGRAPAAWLDLDQALPGDVQRLSCRERVALYLKGHVGIRPMVDLNGYFLLVLNADPSITVIDPVVGIAGRTSLYATVLLRKPGADWVPSADGKRLFVSMPRADRVAVVDTERFRVEREIETGPAPTRLALQADGRYLWAGTGGAGKTGGVSVIDTERLAVVAHLETGAGHHELAFGPGDRVAFVTNRESRTVTAIDVARLEPKGQLRTGPVPISIARSSLSEAIYVADGASGDVAVVDPDRLEVTARIPLAPGLGPLRFAPGGRYGFVVNPAAQTVHVFDVSQNRLAHAIALPGQPYELAFTDTHAFVRLLDSERVQLIRLASLDGPGQPVVQSFAAGARAPRLVPELAMADSMVPQPKAGGVFVVAPADGSTFGYMEGMNAPSGSFQNYGHAPRSVRVLDRSLRETGPGEYTGRFVLPAAGTFDVALLLDSPRLLHCFRLEGSRSPGRAPEGPPLRIDWSGVATRVPADTVLPIRFHLEDPETGGPKEGLADARLAFFAVTGPRTEVPAREVAPGLYEAPVRLPRPGAYYLHLAAPSLGVSFGDLPFRAVRADAPGGRPR